MATKAETDTEGEASGVPKGAAGSKPRTRRSTAAKAKARTPAEVARAGFDAVIAHDVDGILENWSPDGIQDWVALGVFRGHDQIRDLFEQVFAATPDIEMIVERIVADDETACVQWRSVGTFTGGPLGISRLAAFGVGARRGGGGGPTGRAGPYPRGRLGPKTNPPLGPSAEERGRRLVVLGRPHSQLPHRLSQLDQLDARSMQS